MICLLKSLWNDNRGFVVSSELALVSTLGVLGLTAGLARVGGDVTEELTDMGAAVSSLDQSFMVTLPDGRVLQYADSPSR